MSRTTTLSFVSVFLKKKHQETYISKPQFKCVRINRAKWFSDEVKGRLCNQVDKISMSCSCGTHMPIFSSVNK